MIDIADLISKINLLEYCQQYLSFEEKNGEYMAISPFSGKDTDPSFTITPGTNLYYDFSHSSGGNILNFIQRFHKVNFKKAVEIACAYCGGDVKELPEPLEATKYIKKFVVKERVQKPIKYKKLSDEIMEKYLFDLDRLQVWIDEGISVEVMQKYQVKYDPFSNRIVFPIWNENGDIINVKGRTLDDNYKSNKTQKYQNYFDIGRCDYVYNLNFAKEEILRKGRVIVFESEKSVLIAESNGVHNSVALMTSHLNYDQLKIFIKLGADVILALDKDVDISKDENVAKLKKYVRVQYIKDKSGLLDEKDAPVDKGWNIFKQLYLKRTTLRP